MKIEERAALPTLADQTVPADPRADRRQDAAGLTVPSVTNDIVGDSSSPRPHRDGVHVRDDRPRTILGRSSQLTETTPVTRPAVLGGTRGDGAVDAESVALAQRIVVAMPAEASS